MSTHRSAIRGIRQFRGPLIRTAFCKWVEANKGLMHPERLDTKFKEVISHSTSSWNTDIIIIQACSLLTKVQTSMTTVVHITFVDTDVASFPKYCLQIEFEKDWQIMWTNKTSRTKRHRTLFYSNNLIKRSTCTTVAKPESDRNKASELGLFARNNNPNEVWGSWTEWIVKI